MALPRFQHDYEQGCAIVSLLSQVLVLILHLAIVLVLELKLVSQRSPGQYCYWYWYCNLHSANIGIDIAIGKHSLLLLVLALLLQNTFSKYCHCYWNCKSIFQVLMKKLHQKLHYSLTTQVIYKCKITKMGIHKLRKWSQQLSECPFSTNSIFLMDLNSVSMPKNGYCIEIDIAKHIRPE